MKRQQGGVITFKSGPTFSWRYFFHIQQKNLRNIDWLIVYFEVENIYRFFINETTTANGNYIIESNFLKRKSGEYKSKHSLFDQCSQVVDTKYQLTLSAKQKNVTLHRLSVRVHQYVSRFATRSSFEKFLNF